MRTVLGLLILFLAGCYRPGIDHAVISKSVEESVRVDFLKEKGRELMVHVHSSGPPEPVGVAEVYLLQDASRRDDPTAWTRIATIAPGGWAMSLRLSAVESQQTSKPIYFHRVAVGIGNNVLGVYDAQNYRPIPSD